ncbi:MAG TPA: contractile injection system tape measure protein, partial [Verrucomicrobiae bacterium]|nr:contractile injection system tape measure protein [Verrucomicrobiae bacterium]
MATPVPNRILREIVDIHCHGERNGMTLRHRLEELCGNRLTRAIDGVLASQEVPENQLVSIDRLQVTVDGITSGNLETELIPRIASALEAELTARIGAGSKSQSKLARPLRQSVLEEILFFLERGYLPWSSDGGALWRELAEETLRGLEPMEFLRLAEVLRESGARKRLARHFPEAVRENILPTFWSNPEWRLVLADVAALCVQMPGGPQWTCLKEHLLRLLLDVAVAERRPSLEWLCRMILRELFLGDLADHLSLVPLKSWRMRRAFAERELARTDPAKLALLNEGLAGDSAGMEDLLAAPRNEEAKPVAPVAETPLVSQRKAPPLKPANGRGEDAIYIRNAGLVILAPYVPMLFRRLVLADDERLLKLPTALSLLHYLVFGVEECAEWDLVLNKLFCGVLP